MQKILGALLCAGLTVVSACKHVDTASGLQSEGGGEGGGGNSAAALDRQIKNYQFDAMLCALSPIISGIPGSTPALEASKCALARNTLEGKAKTNFRQIPIPGFDDADGTKRLATYMGWRVRINAALDALSRKFNSLNPQGGLIRVTDVIALRSSATDDDGKLIGDVFGNEAIGTYNYNGTNIPLLVALLDSTQDSNVDGYIGTTDIDAFRDEINRYYLGNMPTTVPTTDVTIQIAPDANEAAARIVDAQAPASGGAAAPAQSGNAPAQSPSAPTGNDGASDGDTSNTGN